MDSSISDIATSVDEDPLRNTFLDKPPPKKDTFQVGKYARDPPESLSDMVQNSLETLRKTEAFRSLDEKRLDLIKCQDGLMDYLLLSTEQLGFLLHQYLKTGDMGEVMKGLQTKEEFADFLAVWSNNDVGISLMNVIWFSSLTNLKSLFPGLQIQTKAEYMGLPIWVLRDPSPPEFPSPLKNLPWFVTKRKPAIRIVDHGV